MPMVIKILEEYEELRMDQANLEALPWRKVGNSVRINNVVVLDAEWGRIFLSLWMLRVL
jgi:hypothetical protein